MSATSCKAPRPDEDDRSDHAPGHAPQAYQREAEGHEREDEEGDELPARVVGDADVDQARRRCDEQDEGADGDAHEASLPIPRARCTDLQAAGARRQRSVMLTGSCAAAPLPTVRACAARWTFASRTAGAASAGAVP